MRDRQAHHAQRADNRAIQGFLWSIAECNLSKCEFP
jgi:hypothetical protein